MKKNGIVGFCMWVSLVVQAQTPPQNEPAPPRKRATLSAQYQLLKAQSGSFQQYKVVTQTSLDAFFNVVQDSVRNLRQQLQATRQEIQGQNTQIEELRKTITTKDQQMATNNQEASQVKVLGIPMDKNGYVLTSFITYALLAALVIILFLRHQASARGVTEVKGDFESARQEIDRLKQKIIEVQTQLGRELQNERNRVEELQQKLGIKK
jgi:predicted  nucleic acid-binding Zn-ribbon protein